MNETIIKLEGIELIDLLGENNERINLVKAHFPDVLMTSRGNQLKFSGNPVLIKKATNVIQIIVQLIKTRRELTTQTVQDILNGENPIEIKLSEKGNNSFTILHGRNGKPIKAKTHNQKRLLDVADKNDLVFAIGPAGTVKTYTAVALAVRALKNKVVRKIILTRPAVEAGESLGFLPGDLKDKIDPFLRPLYDALDDMIPADKISKFMTDRVIEIAPLAFMRGRTLDNSFIILDEAQNATNQQLKMFLTRLGPSAKCIITGDLTQIDLPRNQSSGLRLGLDLLKDIDGVGVVRLTADDVVRHRLVKAIIKAYSKHNEDERDKYKKPRNGYFKEEE